MSRKPSRDRWHLRTGKKQIGRSRDSEWIITIFQKFGAQKFLYTDAKEMLLEVLNVELPRTTLGAWVRWGWLIAPDKTMETNPRIVYQIPVDMRKTLETIIEGKPRPVRKMRDFIPHSREFAEGWEKPWESSRR